MKVFITAILTFAPVVLAQDQPRIQIQINQTAPVVSPGIEVVGGEWAGNNPVRGAPYSGEAVSETTQTAGDGSPLRHTSSTMVYRDSEGRERRETEKTVTISDPVTGVTYTLDAATRTVRRTLAPRIQTPPNRTVTIQSGIVVTGSMITPSSEPRRPMIDPPINPVIDSAPSVEDLGVVKIEGVQAAGTLTTVTIPASQSGSGEDIHIISEQWYSPELRMTILSRHNDPRTGVTEFRLIHINRNEPAAALFQIPADYTVIDTGLMPR